MIAQLSNNFTKQIENWQGVDVNVSARLRNGLTIQGGTSTGRRLVDSCDLRTNYLPELGAGVDGLANNSIAGSIAGNSQSVVNPWCRIVEPYLTHQRAATYTIPAWRPGQRHVGAEPRHPLAANYVVTNAIALPSLNRNLSNGNVTVNSLNRGRSTAPVTTSTCASRRSCGMAGRGRESDRYLTSPTRTTSRVTTRHARPPPPRGCRLVFAGACARATVQIDFYRGKSSVDEPVFSDSFARARMLGLAENGMLSGAPRPW
jgi:hypothetical protein